MGQAALHILKKKLILNLEIIDFFGPDCEKFSLAIKFNIF